MYFDSMDMYVQCEIEYFMVNLSIFAASARDIYLIS